MEKYKFYKKYFYKSKNSKKKYKKRNINMT